MGSYSTYFEAALAKEVDRFQNRMVLNLRDLWDRLLGRPPRTEDQANRRSRR